MPRAHSVGRAGQLNHPKSRYYSWEIIDHRPIAFVTIDYNALDSDYNTTTPTLPTSSQYVLMSDTYYTQFGQIYSFTSLVFVRI